MMVSPGVDRPQGLEGDVSYRLAGKKSRLNEPARQIVVLFVRQLGVQGYVDFAADVRLIELLDLIDRIQARLMIPRPIRRTLGSDDLIMQNAIFAAVVVHLTQAQITYTLRGSIRARGGRGGRGGRGSPLLREITEALTHHASL